MGWTVTVEDFGRIERAEIEVRPLMLFVGDNNSGKSYLASLLWGIVAMQMDAQLAASPAYASCLHWAAERIGPDRPPLDHTLTPGEVKMFADLFEDAIARSAPALVERIFNAASPRVRSLSFRSAPAAGVRVGWKVDGAQNLHEILVEDSADRSLKTAVRGSFEEARAAAVDALARRVAFGTLTRLFLPFDDTFHAIDPIYMPASRTGFMLLYRSAVQASMRRDLHGERGGGALSELTIPAFHFLDMLVQGLRTRAPAAAARYAEEAGMLERAIGGHIEITSSGVGVQEYRYRMTGSTEPLTMSRSSSLVTEVAPVLLVLRNLRSFPLLVLEEPEAHLHPRLQRVLARVVARMINKGVFVWITTHSTTFCQQINNLLKLGAIARESAAEARQKWGYDEVEALKLDDIAGYQLVAQEDGGRTTVTALRKTEHGLIMPSFNRELVKLGEEIDDLDRRLREGLG